MPCGRTTPPKSPRGRLSWSGEESHYCRSTGRTGRGEDFAEAIAELIADLAILWEIESGIDAAEAAAEGGVGGGGTVEGICEQGMPAICSMPRRRKAAWKVDSRLKPPQDERTPVHGNEPNQEDRGKVAGVSPDEGTRYHA